MVRGFIDMVPSSPQPPDGSAARLQAGVAKGLESVLPMRTGWRGLTDASDLPTTQFEWAIAALNQPGPKEQGSVFYVSDGGALTALLPLLARPRAGVKHLQYLGPTHIFPIGIPHSDRASLELLLATVTRLGRPIHLSNMIAESPAMELLRQISADSSRKVQIEAAEPMKYLEMATIPLQDRSQSAARVSIIATSYGLSGGPNDVIFQFVSPSLDQVMQLVHESIQLKAADSPPAKSGKNEIDESEFLRTHAFHCAQRGEIRFCCLRLAGRLLGVQMIQVRKRTAWLLDSVTLPRFRDLTMSTLLTGETIRKLRPEGVEKLVVAPGAMSDEVGELREIPCVNVTIYPWSSRSLMALMIGRAGRLSTKIWNRRSDG